MVAESHSRNLPFTKAYNFRDVGGYTGLDGQIVRWRRLFRADSLHRLDEDRVADFRGPIGGFPLVAASTARNSARS